MPGHENADVRAAIAAHRLTNARALDAFVRDSAPAVRRAALLHPSATMEHFALLATDEDRTVRSSLAARTELPVEIARMLMNDADDGVRARLALTQSLPVDVALVMAQDGSSEVRSALAHKWTPPEALMVLVGDADRSVRVTAEVASAVLVGQRFREVVAWSNAPAIEHIRAIPEWWNLSVDSDDVTLVMEMYPNRLDGE